MVFQNQARKTEILNAKQNQENENNFVHFTVIK